MIYWPNFYVEDGFASVNLVCVIVLWFRWCLFEQWAVWYLETIHAVSPKHGSSEEFGHSFLYAQQVFQRLQLEQKHFIRVIGEQWYFLWSSSIYQMSDFSRVPPFHRNFLGFLGVVCGLLTGIVCWGGVCVCQFWFAFVFSGHICPYIIVCKPFIYIVALVRYAKCDPVGRCYISIYFAPFTRLSLRLAIAHCSLYGSRIWEICVCACLFW